MKPSLTHAAVKYYLIEDAAFYESSAAGAPKKLVVRVVAFGNERDLMKLNHEVEAFVNGQVPPRFAPEAEGEQ